MDRPLDILRLAIAGGAASMPEKKPENYSNPGAGAKRTRRVCRKNLLAVADTDFFRTPVVASHYSITPIGRAAPEYSHLAACIEDAGDGGRVSATALIVTGA